MHVFSSSAINYFIHQQGFVNWPPDFNATGTAKGMVQHSCVKYVYKDKKTTVADQVTVCERAKVDDFHNRQTSRTRCDIR
jgi:hypothetical protein